MSDRAPIPMPTWKELFARSGNLCFMPGCSSSLFDDEGLKDVNIAHIRGVGQNGPRHVEGLDPAALNSINNLLLLCRKHHDQVDAMPVTEFTIERVTEIKVHHESRIADLTSRLKDFVFDNARASESQAPASLQGWFNFLEAEDAEIVQYLETQMLTLLDTVNGLPNNAKKLLSVIVDRSHPDGMYGPVHLEIPLAAVYMYTAPMPEETVFDILRHLERSLLGELDDPDFVQYPAEVMFRTRDIGESDPFPDIKTYLAAKGAHPDKVFEYGEWHLFSK